jgi:hypothetical protein
VVEPRNPMLSSALLAHGGQLTVHEQVGVGLDADLVVLSACDTGRGEVTGGEDVIGLVRGLLGAGARTVIAALWGVFDPAASLLMAVDSWLAERRRRRRCAMPRTSSEAWPSRTRCGRRCADIGFPNRPSCQMTASPSRACGPAFTVTGSPN